MFHFSDIKADKEKMMMVTYKSVGVLSTTNLLSAVAQQSDKIILGLAMGGEAVTTFYVATLLGKVISLLTTPLNGVLIGYLTKYEGKFTKKMVAVFTAVLLGLGIVAVVGCYIASEIFVKLLLILPIYGKIWIPTQDFGGRNGK